MSTAIITGGSRGLGLALAGALVNAEWDVIIDGRSVSSIERAAVSLGAHVTVVPGDVGDPSHREELVRRAAQLGGLDLLVNNASDLGPTPLPALRDVDPEALVELYRVNVVAPLALVQLALPLLERSGGVVVNVTSDAAVEAYEGWGAYGSSKSALEQMSHVLVVEEPALRVWCFDPGDMRTDMHQAAFPGEDISDRPMPEDVAVPAFLELLATRAPSGRVRASDVVSGWRS